MPAAQGFFSFGLNSAFARQTSRPFYSTQQNRGCERQRGCNSRKGSCEFVCRGAVRTSRDKAEVRDRLALNVYLGAIETVTSPVALPPFPSVMA